MNSPEIKSDGTYIYRDSNGSIIMAVKVLPICVRP